MRMRTSSLILSVFFLIALSSCTVVSTLRFTERDIDDTANLVLNPGFNSYSVIPSEALKGWSLHLEAAGTASSNVVVDPAEAMEGKTSLRIDASDNSVLILSDPFKVRRYGGYYLRSFCKTNSTMPPNVQLRFIVFKENGKIVNRFRYKAKPQSDWAIHAISAGFIRPGAKFGRLAIFIPPFKDGSVWLDNTGCFEVHGFKID